MLADTVLAGVFKSHPVSTLGKSHNALMVGIIVLPRLGDQSNIKILTKTGLFQGKEGVYTD